MKKNFIKINIRRRSIVAFLSIILITATMTATVGIGVNKSFPEKTLTKNPTSSPLTLPTSLVYSFSFNEPDFRDVEMGNRLFTSINMPGCMAIGRELGSPNIPIKFVKLLLPPGKEVTNIDVTGVPIEIVTSRGNLEEKPVIPYQEPVPIGDESPSEITYNDEIYESSDIFPSEIFKNQGVGYCRGYSILTVALTPIQYIPADGRLFFISEMTVNIELRDNGFEDPFYRVNSNDEEWVKSLVHNPEITDYYSSRLSTLSYPGGICNPIDNYDYVIITTTHNGLDHWTTDTSTPYNWTSLMDKHASYDGLSCTLVTMQDINAESDYWNTTPLFNDTAAHIREFCRDAYQDWGTEYVFIGGDDEWIPAREMDYDYESNCDSDLYWSNLHDTFNDDGDNDWGEEGDTGFDLYSELYIGRITCDTPQDVSNWMKKSFYYADSFDKDYLENAAFYGCVTGWNCHGDDFIDYSAIKGTSNWLGPTPGAHGAYPTWLGFQYGFETWNALNPFQEYNLSVKWSANSVPNPGWQGGSESAAIAGMKNAINNNDVTLISGIAHANAGMSLDVYDTSWEADYHNTMPFFIHDYGCHCGDMDAEDDGVLHSMLFHSDTELAFACVYHTSYGWGSQSDTNSSSAVQQKLFWDYMFDTVNNSGSTMNWQLGKAQAFSKDAMAPMIDWTYTGAPGSWRGTIEACLLFGDPAQRIKPPFQPEHGIAVTNLDIPDYVAHNETAYVSALISNVGKNNESNILVNFTVNASVLDSTISVMNSTIISNLSIGQSELVSFSWKPDIGTYLVGIEVQPVAGENITLNNALNKTVHIIPAPDIWLDPTVFNFNLNEGITVVDTLTIGNEPTAEANLTFSISYAGDLGWLSVNPESDSVAVGNSLNLSVTINSSGLAENTYRAFIVIASNDLDESTLYVPVNLSVVFACDAGPVSVNYPTGENPVGLYTVNASIENFGSDNQTVPVNCSIYESGGGYFADFESDNGGWVASASWDPVGDWEWTDSYDYGSYSGSNNPPPAAYSGDGLWATVPHGDYTNSGGYNYLSQTFDFTGFTNAEMSWYNWCEVFYSFDTAKLFVEGTLVYERATSSIPTVWDFETVDLSAWDGQASVEIVFELYATTVVEKAGWYIDDVSISSNLSREPGDLIYQSFDSVYIPAYSTAYVEFSPSWNAATGHYVIKLSTMLPGDQDTSNDLTSQTVTMTAGNDVGAVAINYPIVEQRPGYHTVNATIENFGIINQTTPVNCSIYNSTHTLVYGADTSVFVSARGTAYVEFSPTWYVSTEGDYLINVTTRLPGDECDINNATEANVTIKADMYLGNIEGRWNFISVPFNKTIDKTQLFVYYNGTDYNWTEATDPANGPLIDSFIFGWNRGTGGQTYQAVDALEPGYGYWMYAYSDCELWARGLSNITTDNYVTGLDVNWNIMGIPYDQSIEKNTLIIRYNGTDYNWTEAIDPANGPLVDAFIFGWNRGGPSGQTYQAADSLEPGYSYWMYSYYPCILKR
jgi:hypothetical protein